MVVRLPGGDVVLAPGQVSRLVRSVDALDRLARERGGRVPADVRRIAADMSSAVGTSEHRSAAGDEPVVYEWIDTTTAAGLLGCTARNVTSLVARGQLTGRRQAGRVLCRRSEVEARAARHRRG